MPGKRKKGRRKEGGWGTINIKLELKVKDFTSINPLINIKFIKTISLLIKTRTNSSATNKRVSSTQSKNH